MPLVQSLLDPERLEHAQQNFRLLYEAEASDGTLQIASQAFFGFKRGTAIPEKMNPNLSWKHSLVMFPFGTGSKGNLQALETTASLLTKQNCCHSTHKSI